MAVNVIALQPLVALIAGILILIIPASAEHHRCIVFDCDRPGRAAAASDAVIGAIVKAAVVIAS